MKGNINKTLTWKNKRQRGQHENEKHGGHEQQQTTANGTLGIGPPEHSNEVGTQRDTMRPAGQSGSNSSNEDGTQRHTMRPAKQSSNEEANGTQGTGPPVNGNEAGTQRGTMRPAKRSNKNKRRAYAW